MPKPTPNSKTIHPERGKILWLWPKSAIRQFSSKVTPPGISLGSLEMSQKSHLTAFAKIRPIIHSS
jgi:hypothetical protein